MSIELEGIRPKELELEWSVLYKDHTELNQNFGVGEENGEHHFGHIDQDNLLLFILGSKEDPRLFTVDIEDQTIEIAGLIFHIEFPHDQNGDIVKGKLVYFRRNRVDFIPEGPDISVKYCIGLQANIDGKNFQQYVFINPDGTFTLSQQK